MVEIGDHKAKAVFGVAPMLAVIVNLSKALIDKEIDRTEAKSGQSIPEGGHAVAIVKTFEEEDAVKFTDGITTGSVCTT